MYSSIQPQSRQRLLQIYNANKYAIQNRKINSILSSKMAILYLTMKFTDFVMVQKGFMLSLGIIFRSNLSLTANIAFTLLVIFDHREEEISKRTFLK